MTLRLPVLVAALAVLPASRAEAQVKRPLAPYVFDIRGFYTPLGQDETTALDLGVTVAELPARGLGGVAGLHVYPLRRARFAFGLGAEYLLARGRRTPETAEGAPPPVEPIKPPIEQRLVGLSPQLSLNFGHREGWSYLTAGMGPFSFETFEGTVAPEAKPESKNTINMGGGARWFFSSHVAFTFDVRFYLTRPQSETAFHPGKARSRLRVLSAGISIR